MSVDNSALTDPAIDAAGEDDEILAYLLELEEDADAVDVAPPALERRPTGTAAPLSFGQQRLWLLEQIEGHNPALHLTLPLGLQGPLDVTILRNALLAVMTRHEVLRTGYVLERGQPVQRVLDEVDLALPCTDLSTHDGPARRDALAALVSEAAREPFDLATGPLVRARLARLAARDHILVLVLHHTVTDRRSMEVLTQELLVSYHALARNMPSPLVELAVQYGDYATWERARLADELIDEDLVYWRRKLAGLEPLSLPGDRARPAFQSFVGAYASTVLLRGTVQALEKVARKHGATRFMAMLALLAGVLARYSGQGDVAVGTPTSTRSELALENLVGFFLDTLVLRVDCAGSPSFVELLERARETTLEAYAHRNVPFERLVQALNPPRDLSRTPIFQVLFVQVDQALSSAAPTSSGAEPDVLADARGALASAPEPEDDVLRVVDYSMAFSELTQDAAESVQYDLEVYLRELPDGLRVSFVYNVELFEAELMRRMLDHFSEAVQRAAAAPDASFTSLIGISEAERRTVLGDWNATQGPYPTDSLHRQVWARAGQTPDAEAVRAGESCLSYAQLRDRAQVLAAHLQTLGVSAGDRVGICVERNLDLPVAVLGVLSCGAAYVPLDPGFPVERLHYMADDADLALVITQSSIDLTWPAVPTLDLEREGARLWSRASADARSMRSAEATAPDALSPGALSYVTYTSGSTGRPKGVCVSHDSVSNFLAAMAERPGLTADDVLVAVTTLSFDISVLELLLPLVTGARVVIASRETAADGEALARLLDHSGATVLQATPATWRVLLRSGWRGNRALKALCGGEALSPELAVELLARVGSLWNLYGPTEATVWATVEAVEAGNIGQSVAIGRPISNLRAYVLDAQSEPVPIGVPGELWLGGTGVAHGYWRRDELTAERFLPDPFVDAPAADDVAARMYRTGDLARWRADGRLEHLGRLDDQVKVRGYRIELGEIQSVLEAHSAVAQAVVVSREQTAGDVRLLAYVVLTGTPAGADSPPARGADSPDVDRADALRLELRDWARERLPAYMVPVAVTVIEQVPLTPNGKVDRRALPAPVMGTGVVDVAQAPETPAEQALAEVWQSLLGIPALSVADNFFDLGGHSLLVITAIEQMRERTGIAIAAREYMMQSLRQIAALYAMDDTAADAHDPVEAPDSRSPDSRSPDSRSPDSKSPVSKFPDSKLPDSEFVERSTEAVSGQASSTAQAPVSVAPAAHTGTIEVEPVYFGSGGRALFGCYHAPREPVLADRALVICQPLGPEYIRCHRMLRVLAASLARAGLPVFRFDYFGCGDSLGDDEDVSLERCIADVGEAVRFVRQRTRALQVDLLGIRLGAAIALSHAAATGGQVQRIAMWDPVVRGSDFLGSMRDQRSHFARWVAQVCGREPTPSQVEGPRDFLGFRFSHALLSGLEELDLEALTRGPCEDAFILENSPARADGAESMGNEQDGGAAAESLCAHLRGLGVRMELEYLDSPRIWLAEPHQGLVPRASLERLTAWMLDQTHSTGTGS